MYLYIHDSLLLCYRSREALEHQRDVLWDNNANRRDKKTANWLCLETLQHLTFHSIVIKGPRSVTIWIRNVNGRSLCDVTRILIPFSQPTFCSDISLPLAVSQPRNNHRKRDTRTRSPPGDVTLRVDYDAIMEGRTRRPHIVTCREITIESFYSNLQQTRLAQSQCEHQQPNFGCNLVRAPQETNQLFKSIVA